MRGRIADSPSSEPPNGEPPPRPRWLIFLDAICRYLAAAVFLMAGITKITALSAFSDQLALPPPWLALAVAAVIAWLELTCGFCLLSGVAVREAAVLGGLMLLAFTAYLLIHRPEKDCGCVMFPVSLPLAIHLPTLLARNVTLLACCVRLAWPRRG